MKRRARELYGSAPGRLFFVIGSGPSIRYARRFLSEPADGVVRIAVNRAITEIPAEIWFGIDGDAYLRWRGERYAKGATRVFPEDFQDAYDADTLLWERCGRHLRDDLESGKLVHRATSVIGACSLAWRMGARRIVLCGCDNRVTDEEAQERRKELGMQNVKERMQFTFCRISEAFRNRDKWMPPGVSVADASFHDFGWGGINWDGKKRMERTMLDHELRMHARRWGLLKEEVRRLERGVEA